MSRKSRAKHASPDRSLGPGGIKHQLDRLPIDQFVIPEHSPQDHSERQISMVMASISEFGIPAPICVTSTNEIVVGLVWFLAAQRLGMTDLPIVRIEGMSRKRAAAFSLAYARLLELSKWNEKNVREILLSLPDLEIDLEAMGFEVAEADIILSLDDEAEEAAESLAPEPDPIIRTDDLIQCGPHLMLCGDSLKPENLARLMGGKLANLSVNDPGYNVRVNGHVSSTKRHKEFAMASGEMSDSIFEGHLASAHRIAAENVEPGALIYSSMDAKGLVRLLNAGESAGLEILTIAVWGKTNANFGNPYRNQCEFYGVFRRTGAPHRNNIQLGKFGRSRTNLWSYAGANTFSRTRDEDLKMHPTVKPVALIEDIIKDTTRRQDQVLDLFGGSGTTMIAAQRCGRVARLMEISPGYVETAARRFERLFGIEAVHVETGMTLSELGLARAREAGAIPRRRVRVRQSHDTSNGGAK